MLKPSTVRLSSIDDSAFCFRTTVQTFVRIAKLRRAFRIQVLICFRCDGYVQLATHNEMH